MNRLPAKFGKRSGVVAKRFRGKGKGGGNTRSGGLGFGVVAFRRAAIQGERSVVRIHGEAVAILPLRNHRRLEWLLEQEEKERELDRLDVQEAERRLSDPTQVPIPFDQALREYGISDVSD